MILPAVLAVVWAPFVVIMCVQVFATKYKYRTAVAQARAEAVVVRTFHELGILLGTAFIVSLTFVSQYDRGLGLEVGWELHSLAAHLMETWIAIVIWQTISAVYIFCRVPVPKPIKPLLIATWVLFWVASPAQYILGYITNHNLWNFLPQAQHLISELVMLACLDVSTLQLLKHVNERDMMLSNSHVQPGTDDSTLSLSTSIYPSSLEATPAAAAATIEESPAPQNRTIGKVTGKPLRARIRQHIQAVWILSIGLVLSIPLHGVSIINRFQNSTESYLPEYAPWTWDTVAAFVVPVLASYVLLMFMWSPITCGAGRKVASVRVGSAK